MQRQMRAAFRMNVVALFVLAVAMPAAAAPESYRVDPDHSIPTFEISHLGLAFVRGLFKKIKGDITIDRAAKTGELEIVIESASVATNLERRDALIREWFKVEQFPTMVYRAKKLTFSGDDVTAADGELTFMGVTRPVSLALTHFRCIVNPVNKRQLCGADGIAQIKRSEFGLTGLSNSIGEDVKIAFGIEAIRQ
jgi:polyisoprenoid-binding protein YceI